MSSPFWWRPIVSILCVNLSQKFVLFPLILEDFFWFNFNFNFVYWQSNFSQKCFVSPFDLFIFCHDIRSRRRLQRINHILKIFCLESGKEIMPIWTLIQALCLLHTNNNKTYHYINRMKAGVMKKIIMMMMKWLYQDSHYLHW